MPKQDPTLIRFLVLYIENIFPEVVKMEDPYNFIETKLEKGDGLFVKEFEGKKVVEMHDADDIVRVELTKDLILETFISYEINRGNYDVVSTVQETDFTAEIGKQLLEDVGADYIVEAKEQDNPGDMPTQVYHLVKLWDTTLKQRVEKLEL